VRQGLKSILDLYDDIEVVGEAADGEEAVELTQAHRPDIVIMDVNMPKLNGVAATREICILLPKTKVIGLSYDMSTTRSMCQAGAVTCIDKAYAVEQLYEVICQVNSEGMRAVSNPPSVFR
jgi:DNA-binding NarL/FixJ family response regulator